MGRAEELRRLEQGASAALEGSATAFLVAGDAGVGRLRSDELYRGHPLRPFLAELDRGAAGASGWTCACSTASSSPSISKGILGSRPDRGVRRVASSTAPRATRSSPRSSVQPARFGSAAADAARHPPVRIESRSSAAARALLRGRRRGRSRVCPSGCSRRCPTGRGERDEALREAVEHHLLVPTGEDGYAFRHALLREAVYDELLPGRAQPAARGLRRGAERRARSWPADDAAGRRSGASLVRGARSAARARRLGRGRARGEQSVGDSLRPACTTSARLSCGTECADAEALAGLRSRGSDAPRGRGGESRRRSRARGGADPPGAQRSVDEAQRRGAAVGAAGPLPVGGGRQRDGARGVRAGVRLVPGAPRAVRGRIE